ncbi:hypothetical protein [Arthrobacter oryzae]|uniref:DUF1918 domain-containing protein n=1 Tax=Arthrobacter oryzae TaxID=409290 RepID=A0A495ES53_9MICC|nr:hypothetical protein [Arthrobacter oryzae]RKR18877.1 hypothetical protein C8D78_2618 [Arthrobacter oryzae]
MTLQKNRPSGRSALWDDVEIGDAVHLRRGGRVELEGRVDNRTGDGAVVWVVSEGGRRQMFHVADGFELSVADPEGAGRADS